MKVFPQGRTAVANALSTGHRSAQRLAWGQDYRDASANPQALLELESSQMLNQVARSGELEILDIVNLVPGIKSLG
jgi:hypothetical protein